MSHRGFRGARGGFKGARGRPGRMPRAPRVPKKGPEHEEDSADDEMNARFKFQGVVSDRKALRKAKRMQKKQKRNDFYKKRSYEEIAGEAEEENPKKKQKITHVAPVKETSSKKPTLEHKKKERRERNEENVVEKSANEKETKGVNEKRTKGIQSFLQDRGLIPAPIDEEKEAEYDRRVIKQMERKLFINVKKKKAIGGGLDMFLKGVNSDDEDEFAQLKYLQGEESVSEGNVAETDEMLNDSDEEEMSGMDIDEEDGEEEEKGEEDAGSDMEDEEEDMSEEREEADMEEAGEDESAHSGLEMEFNDESEIEDENFDDEEDEESGGSDEGEEKAEQKPEETAVKYVPPHLRKRTDDSAKEQLRREVRGQINRLAEGTFMAIVKWTLPKLKANRHDVLECIREEIMANCMEERMEQSQMMVFYAALIAFLHGVVCVQFGGVFIETMAKEFQGVLAEKRAVPARHLVALLCNLYNFKMMGACLTELKVVHSALIFELIRKLVAEFKELHVELILLIIKTIGTILRSDDPNALKSIIQLAFQRAQEVGMDVSKFKGSSKKLVKDAEGNGEKDGEKFAHSKRMEFMMDTLLSLKNNKLKHDLHTATYNETLNRMKTLVMRELKAKHNVEALETIRISWDDLVDSSSKGRYWLVGSAFAAPSDRELEQKRESVKSLESSANDELSKLARKHNMNTETRKAIFLSILTSEDYLDAFEKIMRLQLKAHQERDIVSVVFYCLQQEKRYNPIYGFLASKLCSFMPSCKFTFKVTLWDHVKALKEKRESAVKGNMVVAHFYATLLADASLPITALKVLEVGSMSAHEQAFYERLFAVILTQPPSTIQNLFNSVHAVSQKSTRVTLVDQLLRFLKLFGRRVLRGEAVDIYFAQGAMKEHIVEAIKLARQTLKNRASQPLMDV